MKSKIAVQKTSSATEATESESTKSPISTEYQLKKYLLLLATLVATVTYAAGLNLPGGVWQENTQDGGRLAGDLILRGTHYGRYIAFYYCNATAFASSLVVCLLLLVLESEKRNWDHALRVVMLLDLFGLMGAYVAGSCRDKFTTIYALVIMSAIFGYIVLAFFIYLSNKYLGNQNHEAKSRSEVPAKQNREDQQEVLMLLATFAVTITYVAGLNPPGGFWSNTLDGHRVSNPILQDSNPIRYQAFFVCNTTAFVASLLIIMLLLDKKLVLSTWLEKSKSLNRDSLRYFALYGFIIIALCGLVGAYAAGSCRELDGTTYVICLIVAVLAYIFLQVAIANVMPNNGALIKIRNLFVINTTPPADNSDTKPKDNVNEANKPTTTAADRDTKPKDNVNVNEANKPTTTAANMDTKPKGKVNVNEALEKARNLVVLLATLVASITYQAGFDPPGGLWPDDQDGHKVGDPILLTTHPARYKVFFYSNSAAFVASLVVIIMVQSKFLLMRHTLEAAMLLDLFGLIGAYAAGSCRDMSTSIYVIALAGAVLVYVVIHIVFFTLEHSDNNEDSPLLDNRREVLLLLAILVATLTYQAGLTPPGGFWLANDDSGHQAGFPVLLDNYPARYNAFFYCNAVSFMASVALIVLLVNPNLYRPGIRCYALYVCMVAGMFGLMGAYAAGSSRRLRTSIYVLTLVAAVFAFVILQVVIFFWFRNHDEIDASGNKRNGSSKRVDPANVPSVEVEGSSDPSKRGDDDKDIESSGSREKEVPEKKEEEQKKKRDKELKEKPDKDLREYLVLLGVLAASVTYQSGLLPPGGLWEDNDGHTAGDSILHDINKRRYHVFFYCNSSSFMASIVVVAVLLLPKTLRNHKLQLWPMHTAIVLNMLGLLGAYAAGSTRDWESSRNVIFLVIPVLVYIGAYAACSFLGKKGHCHKEKSELTNDV